MKNLPLDRSLIPESIKKYNSDLEYTYTHESGNRYICKAQLPDQKPALVNFFYNANGKTTINVQGANRELGQLIAEHVKAQCSIVVPYQGTISLKNLDPDNFEFLLTYLIEDCDVNITASDIPHGKKHVIEGIQGDSVVLTYYDTKTFLMQGCPLLLHSQIIEFLCDCFSLDDIIQSQLNLVSTGISSNTILAEMNGVMPLSFDYLEPMVKTLISPSIALMKLDIELEDYSVIAFPALRGLEGYLKNLFLAKGITIGRDGFSPFLSTYNYATVSQKTRDIINCDNTCTAINQCYNLYKNERHGLFHANGILANTRILSDKAEAVAIVNDIISQIEISESGIRG